MSSQEHTHVAGDELSAERAKARKRKGSAKKQKSHV